MVEHLPVLLWVLLLLLLLAFLGEGCWLPAALLLRKAAVSSRPMLALAGKITSFCLCAADGVVAACTVAGGDTVLVSDPTALPASAVASVELDPAKCTLVAGFCAVASSLANAFLVLDCLALPAALSVDECACAAANSASTTFSASE